jgi:alpha-ketoglutarate-dependent taurine dioxygenase
MTSEIPAPPVTPAAWMGVELADSPEMWTRHWTDRQLDDLLHTAAGFDPVDLTNLDPLRSAPSSIRDLADEIRSDLLEGLGFALMSGLPVDKLDRTTTAAAFLILGGLIGRPRSQNASGHLLGHVKDVDADLTDTSTRIYQTHERQTFHTDSSDAVALLCLKTARTGGLSMVASAETAYRIVHDRRPDLAARLFDPLATDRRDEQAEGQKPWFEIPVLSWYDDRLTVLYQRTYIDSAQRFDDAPKPDNELLEALDLFDEVLNDPAVHLIMQLEPGDMQFVYNHSLLHDRTAFVDHAQTSERRHLLRLWLSLPGDRVLPSVFSQRYGSIAVGDRGGIVVSGRESHVPLDV